MNPGIVSLPVIQAMGRCVFDPIWAQRQHADRQAEILHVLRGRAVVQTPTYRIVGREGDTIYTPSGMPHRDVFAPGSVFEVYLVRFTWQQEREVLGQYAPSSLAAIRGPSRLSLADVCHRLYQEFSSDRPLGRELAGVRLLEILLTMCSVAEAKWTSKASRPCAAASLKAGPTAEPPLARQTRGRRTQILQQAKRLMRENLAQPLSLQWLADQLNVSPYYLSRVFSEDSGFRLSHYLTDLRMNHARGLLAEGCLRVAQVAHAVGYRDPHYFTKVYRAHFGQSPSASRLPAPPPAIRK